MADYERITALPPLPPRPRDGHKGLFGRVLIVAGSQGMSGAAALAGLGALRGGAGLVTVAVPRGVLNVVAGFEPCYMTVPLPEDYDGRLSSHAAAALVPWVEAADVVAVGPGWGRSSAAPGLIRQLLATISQPLVIDADALTALGVDGPPWPGLAGPRVLTPHPGEFARLTGLSTAQIQADRIGTAVEFARREQVVLLLKGADTVITDGRRVALNPTGNSGMSTGGCGDVLTGLIAALLGQQMPPIEAAQLAAWLHGRAGDEAAAELSQPGLIASDLPRYLGRAWLAAEAH